MYRAPGFRTKLLIPGRTLGKIISDGKDEISLVLHAPDNSFPVTER
jgi:hypothetical protein